MQEIAALSTRAVRRLALVPAVLALAAPARAQEFEGARLLSVAGGQRSSVTLSDAIFINPAGLALGTVYALEANAQDDLDGFERIFAGSIVDSQAGPVAAGLSYVFTHRRFEETEIGTHREKAHRGDLALATRLAEGLALGFTLRYISIDEEVGEEELEGGYDLFTVDAGLQWQQQGGGFSVGLAAYNLTNPDPPKPPISWGGGLGYGGRWFSLSADIRYNAKIGKARFSGSTQFIISDVLPLRAGVAYDLADESVTVSGGIGYQQGGFGIDVGYRERVVDGMLPEGAPRQRMAAIALRTTVF